MTTLTDGTTREARLHSEPPWTGWTAQVAGAVAMLAGAGAVAALLAAVNRLPGRGHR